MKNVKRIRGSVRQDSEEIKEVGLSTYTKTHFGMFEGKGEMVTLRFTNNLLDAVVDRFGTKGAIYQACDGKHFTVTTKVHLSKPFYGWVFGFGNQAKILSPETVKDEFRSELEKLVRMYEPNE
jgi:predicted DNA-binding transcriptional regulator YafY